MPMDAEFMVTDSLEAIRPKMVVLKNIEEVANAVDEMFASTALGSGGKFFFSYSLVILITVLAGAGDGSGEDSGDEGERPGKEDDEDEDEEDAGAVDSPVRFVISTIVVFTSCLTDR
jgi:regulator of nonsense transcripts 2